MTDPKLVEAVAEMIANMLNSGRYTADDISYAVLTAAIPLIERAALEKALDQFKPMQPDPEIVARIRPDIFLSDERQQELIALANEAPATAIRQAIREAIATAIPLTRAQVLEEAAKVGEVIYNANCRKSDEYSAGFRWGFLSFIEKLRSLIPAQKHERS